VQGNNGLGVALLRHGQYEEAKQALQKAVEVAPQYVSARNNLAAVLRAIRRGAERAVAAAPSTDNYDALVNALNEEADTLQALGQQDEAERLRVQARQVMEAAGAEETDDPQQLARNAQKFLDLAAQQGSRAEQMRQRNNQAELDQAVAAQSAYGAQAERVYRGLLAAGTSAPDSWTGLGHALVHQGRREEALTAYAKAVEIDSSFAAGWAAWGRLLAMLGRVVEATDKLERALQADPNQPNALLDLSRIYVGQQRFAEAISLMARLHEQQPENAYVCSVLRQLYQRENRAAEAAKLPCQPKK
jgi:tetratricopeptide (TPR) repeat protein